MEDNKKQVQLEPDVEDMLKTSEAIIKQSVVSGESYMPDSHEFGCSHPSQWNPKMARLTTQIIE